MEKQHDNRVPLCVYASAASHIHKNVEWLFRREVQQPFVCVSVTSAVLVNVTTLRAEPFLFIVWKENKKIKNLIEGICLWNSFDSIT